MADIYARTRLIIGSTSDWAANDLVLGDGELALEVDGSEVRAKVGDGTLAFSAAPYLALGGTGLTSEVNDALALKLDIAGGTMTGDLLLPTLGADPDPNQAVTVQWVQDNAGVTFATPAQVAAGTATDVAISPATLINAAISTSTGAVDAGKIVQTASTGKIDPSLLDLVASSAGAADAGSIVITDANGMIDTSFIYSRQVRTGADAGYLIAANSNSRLDDSWLVNASTGPATDAYVKTNGDGTIDRTLIEAVQAYTGNANEIIATTALGYISDSFINAVTSGGTSAVATRLIKLNGNGKIDQSFLPDLSIGTYLGTADLSQPLPSGTYVSGDFYVASTDVLNANIDPSWVINDPEGNNWDVIAQDMIIFNGTDWDHVSASAGAANYLPLDGSSAMTGTLAMGGNQIINMADGVSDTDAVTVSQLNAVSADVTQNATDITTNAAAIAANLLAIQSNDSEIAQLIIDVAAAQADATQNATDIGDLQTSFSGLGTAAYQDILTSIYDTSDGVMVRGSWGLGTHNPGQYADLDTIVQSGFYAYNGSTLNAPTTDGVVFNASRTGSDIGQLAIGANVDAVYYRRRRSSTWGDWVQLVDDPVQATATDTTSGALMKVGAFGLGTNSTPLAADLDNLPATGFYAINTSTLNSPTGFGNCIFTRYGGYALQIVSSSTGNWLQYRIMSGNAWLDWQDVIIDGASNATFENIRMLNGDTSDYSLINELQGAGRHVLRLYSGNTSSNTSGAWIALHAADDTVPNQLVMGAGNTATGQIVLDDDGLLSLVDVNFNSTVEFNATARINSELRFKNQTSLADSSIKANQDAGRRILQIMAHPSGQTSGGWMYLYGTDDAGGSQILLGAGSSTSSMSINSTEVKVRDYASVERRVDWVPQAIFAGTARDLANSDIGHTILVTATITLNLPTGIGANGSMIQIITGGSYTLTLTGAATIAWLQGGSFSTGTRTIAPNSVITLWRNNSSYWSMWGNGIS